MKVEKFKRDSANRQFRGFVAASIGILVALILCIASCASYAGINPNNNGNGWIVRKSLLADSLMYCFAPANKTDKAVCIDAVDSPSITGDGLDTFINPKKSR